MIEVVFSESACGSLRMAQQYGAGEYHDGAVGLVYLGKKPSQEELDAANRAAEARLRHEWETAVPLGGNPADVYCIDAAWSIGDISENEIGDGRRKVLARLFSILPTEENTDQQIDDVISRNRDALREILMRSSRGEAIRIWYSHNPDDMCGFYWLLAQLHEIRAHGAIYTVRLPEWAYEGQDTLCTYIGWGELSPGKWGHYLSSQQEVQPSLLSACSIRWQQLQKENAPLRIFLNGRLQSAPETIYDSFILQEAERQPPEFREANAVGSVLGKYQLGIGDAWIALRFEQFIKDGLFEVISAATPNRPIYTQTLRKRAR